MDYEHSSFEFGRTVDPFEDGPFDFEKQTGADWYTMALSASLGGKNIHGLNAAPTCETLAKTTYDMAEKYTHAMVKYSEREKKVEQLDDDPDFRVVSGHDYKGSKTSGSVLLAYDSGTWEPSKRTRARNTAVLAAALHATTGNLDESLGIAGFISGGEVSEEAVNHAMVPLSLCKREVAVLGKSNHALYSRGNSQKRISWEDQNLAKEKMPTVAAIDWARLTTIGRYIAEANCRYDPKFRELATLRGVPYMLVKGAWAYVSSADFRIDDTAINWDCAVSCEDHGIPSLADAYSDINVDLYVQARAAAEAFRHEGSNTQAEAILRLLEQTRPRGQAAGKLVMPATDMFVEVTQHAYRADKVASLVANKGTAWEAWKEACRFRVQGDSEADALCKAIAAKYKLRQIDKEKVHQAASLFLAQNTWLIAWNKLSEWLSQPATARTRMAKLKRTVTRSSIPWEVPITIGKRVMEDSFMHVQKMAVDVAVPTKPVNPPKYAFHDIRAAESSMGMQNAIRFVARQLGPFAKSWSKRYQEWGLALAAEGSSKAKAESVLYQAASAAFAHVTLDGILSPDTGFCDMADPRNCYLAKMAVNFARKRNWDPPEVPCNPMESARELAIWLDGVITARVPFVACEEYARDKLRMFAADLCAEREPELPTRDEPPEDLFGWTVAPIPAGMSWADAVDEEAERKRAAEAALDEAKRQKVEEVAPQAAEVPAVEEDFDDALMMELLMGGGADDRVTVDSVMATYADPSECDTYARANGYANFQEAFDAIGEGARFDPETTFCENGMKKMARIARAAADDSVLA